MVNKDVNCKGDNDPVDVVEIGSEALATGAVTKVSMIRFLQMSGMCM